MPGQGLTRAHPAKRASSYSRTVSRGFGRSVSPRTTVTSMTRWRGTRNGSSVRLSVTKAPVAPSKLLMVRSAQGVGSS